MKPEVERHFFAAADLDQESQERYLDEHCPDAELRAEVAGLLKSDRGSEDFLRAPLVNMAAEMERPPQQRIGPYRVVREIGRGGMGAVYEAERQDGELVQKVAIKFVPLAMRTRQMVERFRQERQILANLDHANICRLMDAGTSEDGSPYLVMELIDGSPIDEWCEHLETRAIVSLFVKVCEAVQHAHQNLVIHRDLKPANILVTPAGEPKLLDFGIAKLVDEAHLHEQTTIRAMTPDYASPEQIDGKPMTTSTDVYGLGCVLAKLLTGEVPDRSATPPVRRVPMIKGDLENILGKALQPEPERRYATVQELADDLQRYLRHEPVRATPDSVLYVMMRFARRNRVLAATMGALTISIIAGTLMSTWQARRAERRFQEVRGLANAFLFSFEERIRDIPGTTEARQFLVNTTLAYLERLASEAGGEPDLQLELAAAYRKVSEVQFNTGASSLGDTAGARRSLAKAQSLLGAAGSGPAMREEQGRILLRLGDLEDELGQVQAAMQAGQAVRVLADAWLREQPSNAGALDLGSQASVLVGRALRRMNRLSEAREAMVRAVSLDRLAVAKAPDAEDGSLRLSSSLGWLARILQTQQSLQEAIGKQREAVDILERLKQLHPSSAKVDRALMVGVSRLGGLLQDAARAPDGSELQEALQYLGQSYQIARKRVAVDDQDLRALMDLQAVSTRYGSALLESKKLSEADEVLMAAVETSRRIVKDDGTNREAQLNLGIALGWRADYEHEVRHTDHAVVLRQEARGLYVTLLAKQPNDAKVLYPFGDNEAALVELMRGSSEAVVLCREGLTRLEGFARTETSEVKGVYDRLRQACPASSPQTAKTID